MRPSRLLFLVFVAPFLIIVDLGVMILRRDRDRLEMAFTNSRDAIGRLFGRGRV